MANILITAGPTYEYIDRVRYLANLSSGKMGYELARAAKGKGHQVTLISGPTGLKAPSGVRIIKITSAHQMYQAVMKAYAKTDAVIMAAAVSDYTPVHCFKGKLKKTSKTFNLKLIPTVDILRKLGRKKGKRVLIGFALETDNGKRNALKKLRAKNLDYVVLNSPDAFGSDRSTVEMYSRQGLVKRFNNTSKKQISGFIIKLVSVS
ncbi:MAG: phosphopantothenoylcysteine decarboxylase [Planctomycetes bacterium]|nr:phosphopantothenoylcysteine decarboxylase [Planctomycetota bacterium]